MANKDGFPPDDRFPVFLSEHAEQAGQPDIGKALGRAVISSRILKTSILVATVTAAIGSAILLMGDPVALVSDVTASWVDKSALQPGTDPSTSAIQSIAGTQDLPTTTGDAPARDEIAAAVEPADQSQTGIGQPPALLKQFQAWAAVEGAQPQVQPAQPAQDPPVQTVQDAPAQIRPIQPAQNAPVQLVQDAPAQVRPTKKHRRLRAVHNARAEIRPQRNPRAKIRDEERNAKVQAPPVADARAQDQNAPLPWLLQSFGWRN